MPPNVMPPNATRPIVMSFAALSRRDATAVRLAGARRAAGRRDAARCAIIPAGNLSGMFPSATRPSCRQTKKKNAQPIAQHP